MKRITAFVLTYSLLISCNKKEDKNNSDEARELFQQTTMLIDDISRKISQASDSATIDSLSKFYEKKITDINFSFPPQTDLILTEQENDSIFKLMEEMRKLKNERLCSFILIESHDSIES